MEELHAVESNDETTFVIGGRGDGDQDYCANDVGYAETDHNQQRLTSFRNKIAGGPIPISLARSEHH